MRHIHANRRQFLQSAAAMGLAAEVSGLSFLSRVPVVGAAEASLDPNVVRLSPEIEPTVRLLEDTPREQLLEKVAERIKGGLPYRDVLAALLLAGVRNVQPRPSVGFKFHAVLVVNSAHLASMASPDAHRWLPIFWALDQFKSSQEADVREGNWTMSPVKESLVPHADRARQMFMDAMDGWDVEAADAAVAGLARTAGMNEIFELFYRYGSRDFRDIGHKAIYVANSRRTLEVIGWQHAEPVLRSLAYALLHYNGDNPSQADHDADRPVRRNRDLAVKLRTDWTDGKVDPQATTEFLSVLREGTDEAACAAVVEIINRGVSPQSVWDALFVGAGELLMRQPGIVALHAVTTTNALHYAFQVSADDQTRRMLILQNAAFLPLFRQAMSSRSKVGDQRLDTLNPSPTCPCMMGRRPARMDQRLDTLNPSPTAANGPEQLSEILTDIGSNPSLAAGKVLSYLNGYPEPRELIDAARVLIFLKGTNSHDYKFSSAVFEDFEHVSPAWRNRFLASSVFNLRGSGESDNSLVQRTRAALS